MYLGKKCYSLSAIWDNFEQFEIMTWPLYDILFTFDWENASSKQQQKSQHDLIIDN